MKKSLLALALLGAFATSAQAQSHITIYGIADAYLQYANKISTGVGQDTGNKFAVGSGGMQNSRLGFSGVEDLGNGTQAIFKVESGFSVDSGTLGQDSYSPGAALVGNRETTTRIFGRQAYLGLSGAFGTVTLGRQYDYMADLDRYSSVNVTGAGALTLHGEAASIYGPTGFSSLASDHVTGDRWDNSVKYQFSDNNGLTLGAIYSAGEQVDHYSRGQAVGAGVNYANGPIGIGASYLQTKDRFDGGKAERAFGVGASYQFGPAKVFGLWTRSRNYQADAGENNRNNVYDIGVSYALNNALNLGAGFQYGKYDFIGAENGSLKQLNLGADYSFSKRTDVYFNVMHIRSSDMLNPGIDSSSGTYASTVNGGIPSTTEDNQTAVRVGVRHRF